MTPKLGSPAMTLGLKARPAKLRSRHALLAILVGLPLAACQHSSSELERATAVFAPLRCTCTAPT